MVETASIAPPSEIFHPIHAFRVKVCLDSLLPDQPDQFPLKKPRIDGIKQSEASIIDLPEFALNGHFLTRPDTEAVADLQLFQRHIFFATVGPDDQRGLGGQAQHLAQLVHFICEQTALGSSSLPPSDNPDSTSTSPSQAACLT